MSTPLLALMLNTLRRGGDRCESDVRCDGEAGRWPVGLAPEQTHQRLLHQLSGSSSWALTAAATLFTNCTVQYQHNQPTNQPGPPADAQPLLPGQRQRVDRGVPRAAPLRRLQWVPALRAQRDYGSV